MENEANKERCNSGRSLAREALLKTGKTHRGKHGLGRKPFQQGTEIAAWREANTASISETAKHFDISNATVKRYCAKASRVKANWAAIHAEVAKIDKRSEDAVRQTEWLRMRCNL